MGSLSNECKFSIPEKYRDSLEISDLVDTRSEDEILKQLSQNVPVTSEKNIWAFWDTGLMNTPLWARRNVVDWVRICGPNWTVRVLDNVPESPNYVLKYLPAELFPNAFVDRTMKGPWAGQHSADFIRGAALYTYGGVCMDVGSILIRHIDRICWDELADPNTPYQIALPLIYDQVWANHFIAARKGDPFIKLWHDLIIHIWTGRKESSGMLSHPLLEFAKDETFEVVDNANLTWDWKVSPQTAMEYIWQVLAWVRLCLTNDAGDGFSGTDYWCDKVLVFDTVCEDWPGEMILGFAGSGQKLLDILAMPVDGERHYLESEQYKLAEEVVWTILTSASLQKVTRAKGLTHSPHLGTLWDLPENIGKDQAAGTFADLLRYGSVHFRQTRETIATLEPPRPVDDNMLNKGLFEV
ncbi:putative glycosyl transferase FCK3 [Colletotrichum sp. SAR11_239]|nr:putative glycosyl transferase FCK3 [Colletotrichum sp. SAR11_239]